MIFPFKDSIPAQTRPWMTYGLIAANVVGLLWMLSLDPQSQYLATLEHGFVPARLTAWRQNQPLLVNLEVPDPRFGEMVKVGEVRFNPIGRDAFASLITCMFLHGGWLHLLGNMWMLWIFGDNVEDRLGHWLYLALYLGGGLVASLAHYVASPTSTLPVVGASGAIAAILGAYIVTWPWARIRALVFLFVFITVMDLPALVVLGVWFVTQILESLRVVNPGVSGGVAWWAHIGGFLCGAAVMPLLRGPGPKPLEPELVAAPHRVIDRRMW